jgi:plastocyanin
VRKTMSPRTALAGLLAVCFAFPRFASGAEPSDMEDVRRDLHQLQAQVQALRAAMSEAAELDRQRAAVLTRALKNLPSAPEVAAPAPSSRNESAVSEPRSVASAPPSTPEPRSEAPSRGASHRSAANETSLGAIRGKVEVPAGEPVAYVYVENIVAPPAKGEHKVIQQSGKKFIPGWAVIQRGTAIEFPNRDNIYHNVFSLSAGNSFDLGLYNSSGEAKSHTFTEAGPVDVYCNIHPQMAASVLVVPNRYFAKVKGDGTFEIAGVPVGRRKIVAWAPGSRPTADWIEVDGGRTADLSLKLEAKGSAHKNKSGQSYGSYE